MIINSVNRCREVSGRYILKLMLIWMLPVLLLLSGSVSSAKTETERRIAKSVKKADVVVAGSSSISRWKKAEKHFSPYSVANLGVGGTRVEDWQRYHKYIAKCKPKAIVFYIGGNNIKTKRDNGAAVGRKIIKLLKSVSVKNPKARIYFVSIHPSLRRWKVWNQAQICNKMVKKWCAEQERVKYIDITKDCMKKGKPNKKLLASDGLHFNEKGYDLIWKKIVAARVKRFLSSD